MTQEEPLHCHALHKVLCYVAGMGSDWRIWSREMTKLDFNIRLFGQQREGGPQEDSTKIKIWWLVFWGSPVRVQASLNQGSCPENGDKETDRKNVCELKLNMEIEFVYKELKEWTLI